MDDTPQTELEQLMQELFELTRWRYCSSCHYEGLTYKAPEHYTKSYPLGTICWRMRVHYNGYQPSLEARTPEEVVRKAIEFFKVRFEEKEPRFRAARHEQI
jgi:hypothetical protein